MGSGVAVYRPNLLPYERQIAELAGLTEDEYRFFVKEAYKRAAIRPAEYDHVPDIQNAFVFAAAAYIAPAAAAKSATTTAALVSLAIGVATTAAAYLLMPKPRQQQATTSSGGGQLTLDSIVGGQRFSPTFGFDSQAELASYGDPIPVIFGRWTGTTGGMLITPKLVWSRMFSYGRQQGVKLLFVIGEQGVTEGAVVDGIDPVPALQGIFLGNGVLDSIYDNDFAFYWKRNSANPLFRRIKAADKLYGTRGTIASGDPETNDDIFSCPTRTSENDTGFSAAHSLSNNAEFGCYSPIANGTQYRVNWRVISIPNLLNQRDDPGDNGTYERVKIAGSRNDTGWTDEGDDGGTYRSVRPLGMEGVGRGYSRGMGITKHTRASNGAATTVSDAVGNVIVPVYKDDIIQFTIAHDTIPENYYRGTDREVTVDDINDATIEMRNAADDALQVGEIFMIGRTKWQVTNRSLDIWDIDLSNQNTRQDQIIELKCIDPDLIGANNYVGVVSQAVLRNDYLVDNNEPAKYAIGPGFYPLMKYAEATIRNTRPCEVTEIGIRSTVFQRLNGLCNFRSVPTPQQLINLDSKRVSVTSGTVNAYIKRASVFTIFLRPAGVDASGNEFTWQPLGEQFCVIGSQPIEQYNFIRLTHPENRQYEFKLVPKNGADIAQHSPETTEFLYLTNKLGNKTLSSYLYNTPYGAFKLYAVGRKVTKAGIKQNEEFLNEPATLVRTFTNARPTSVGALNFIPEADNLQSKVTATAFIAWYAEPVFDYGQGYNGSFTWELGQVLGIGSADGYPGNVGTLVVRDYQWNVSGNRWYKVRYTLEKIANPEGHYSGQLFQWIIREENILESSTGWAAGSEFTITFSISPSNPYKTPAVPSGAPTFTTIGQRRRVATVVDYPAVQGRAQGFYEEIFGPARNYNIGTSRTVSIPMGSGAKYIRLDFTSSVAEVLNHWSGQSRQWEAPVIRVSTDPSFVSENWIVGDQFTYTEVVSTTNPFREPGSVIGMQFIIEALGQTVVETYTNTGRVFEGQSQYVDLSVYGNLVDKSNASNPEHTVVYVNEVSANSQAPQYSNMIVAGLALKASRNFTALDQVRFWIKNGIPVKRFHTDESSQIRSSNLFCDLVYYLLTDRVAGVGGQLNMSLNNAQLIDTASLTTTARFLKTNSLFFDGALASTINVRQFIADTAPFMLCNFVIKNGKFGLVPALPTTVNGAISTNPVAIKQLFTAGNIFEDSFELTYISSEERKDFQAVVRFRRERENQLPEERNAVIRWNETASTEHPLESFDMTQYCTNQAHAELVARFFMSVRRRITHSIQFKTSPYGIDLAPGDYIRVVTESNPYSSARNGSISETGAITSATTFTDGQYNILYYKAGSETVESAVMTVSGGLVQQSALFNSVFTLVTSTVSQNVYLIEQLTLDADGAVQISASEFPCDDLLRSLIAQDVTNAARFLVDS